MTIGGVGVVALQRGRQVAGRNPQRLLHLGAAGETRAQIEAIVPPPRDATGLASKGDGVEVRLANALWLSDEWIQARLHHMAPHDSDYEIIHRTVYRVHQRGAVHRGIESRRARAQSSPASRCPR